jgi:hypothetical protein
MNLNISNIKIDRRWKHAVRAEFALRQAQGERIKTDHVESFDSPFVLRFSKDERLSQDRLVEPLNYGLLSRSKRVR